MTMLIFDLLDVSRESSKYDSISVRAPKIRPARTRPGVVTDRWVTVRAPEGVEMVEVETGPMEVRIGSGSTAPVFRVVVPDVDEVYLGDLLGQDEFVEPTVVDRLWAAIRGGGADTSKLDYLLDAINVLARRVGVDPVEWPTTITPVPPVNEEPVVPEDPAAPEEPAVVGNGITIDSAQHFRNLLIWHYLRERGVVEGEYTVTDHKGWVREARNQFPRDQYTAAIADTRAMTQLPFHIDTSQVTDMSSMFTGFQALTTVPDLDTSQVTNTSDMFVGCRSLTDGNVKLIRRDGTKPTIRTDMIVGSGLRREPFYDQNGNPID